MVGGGGGRPRRTLFSLSTLDERLVRDAARVTLVPMVVLLMRSDGQHSPEPAASTYSFDHTSLEMTIAGMVLGHYDSAGRISLSAVSMR